MLRRVSQQLVELLDAAVFAAGVVSPAAPLDGRADFVVLVPVALKAPPGPFRPGVAEARPDGLLCQSLRAGTGIWNSSCGGGFYLLLSGRVLECLDTAKNGRCGLRFRIKKFNEIPQNPLTK